MFFVSNHVVSFRFFSQITPIFSHISFLPCFDDVFITFNPLLSCFLKFSNKYFPIWTIVHYQSFHLVVCFVHTATIFSQSCFWSKTKILILTWFQYLLYFLFVFRLSFSDLKPFTNIANFSTTRGRNYPCHSHIAFINSHFFDMMPSSPHVRRAWNYCLNFHLGTFSFLEDDRFVIFQLVWCWSLWWYLDYQSRRRYGDGHEQSFTWNSWHFPFLIDISVK